MIYSGGVSFSCRKILTPGQPADLRAEDDEQHQQRNHRTFSPTRLVANETITWQAPGVT
jgi:hypothetical protein